jgi:signal transduction histidine kinase/CheY-like chemotaxis protein
MTLRKKAFVILALTLVGLETTSYAVSALFLTGRLALSDSRNVIVLVFYLAIGLLFGAVAMLLLEATIFSRVTRLVLTAAQPNVGGASDPNVAGDELASLTASVNALSAALNLSRAELEARESQSRDIEQSGAKGKRQRTGGLECARGETRAILDASGEAVVVVAPQGKLLTTNERFNNLLGLDESKAGADHVDQLRPRIDATFGADGSVANWIVASLADKQQPLTLALAQLVPKKRDMTLVSIPVLTSRGEYTGRVYSFRPADADAEVEREKSEFVALISHELRTPLTSIKGYVDILLGARAGELSDEQRRFLSTVKRNSERLIALISDLLDMSRLATGKIQLRREPLNVEQAIHHVTRSCSAEIEAKHHRMTVRIPEGLPAVLADRERVQQILTQLLSNAIKYTPQDGTIDVSAREEGNRVRISVRDTGVGLTPDEQAKLFTQFFRAGNPLVEESSGSGLGLTIARSLTRMHGGEIDVSSTPGQGSTFSFTLPVSLKPAAAVSALERRATRIHPGGRILVVDDELDIANLIRLYLERAGYQVLTAQRASDALRIARASHPDLITLDIVLPDADGFTALEWFKNDPETQSIPVILISMLADEGQGKVLGAVGYLTKPVPSEVLLEQVGEILAGDRSRLILVADDHAETRDVIAGHLRLDGYRVVEAENGEQAVAIARRELPGLILMDIQMPVMTGIAALRELRADKRTRDLAVVIMTVHSGLLEENRSVIEMLGVSGLMRKPFTAQELAIAIGEGLDRQEEQRADHEAG